MAGDEDETNGAVEAEELALADEDERLPWLQADDEYEEQGVDTGGSSCSRSSRWFVLAAVIGGGWCLLNDRSDPAKVADGSTIERPTGPYKERPDDPGGTEVAGTGDVSFEVGEGQASPNGARRRRRHRPRTEHRPRRPRTRNARGVGVQVGAYSTRERAERAGVAFAASSARFPGSTTAWSKGTADGSPIYRLQAMAGEPARRKSCAAA